MLDPLPITAGAEARDAQYAAVREHLGAILDGETDWIAAMATVACELHHAFGYFDWTGFYRHALPAELVVGPYQGGHGCLRITFDRGVCGAAARTRETQDVPDVHAVADHIACSGTTRSELVAPVITPDDRLLAVLDIDSDAPAAFTEVDKRHIEAICADLARRFAHVETPQLR